MTHLWFGSALLPTGWAQGVGIDVEGGVIARIEIGAEPSWADERHAIALPGLPNLHSHAFQRGMAGLAEVRGPSGDSFWTWRDIMYRCVDRMDPEDVEAIAAQAYVEMLEAGFTRVGEFHYLHHDRDGTPYADIGELAARIAAAADETGIGLTLLPVFYAHGGFGAAAPTHGQRRFINDVSGFGRLMEASRRAVSSLPDGVVGIAPHSLRAATPGEIEAILPLAGAGPVHIHVAEQVKEVEDCLAFSGARPVSYLYDNADVNERWCLIHATHVTDAETARIAASGAVVGLCPITEANLGDGIFPAEPFARMGGRFGIGSDSNVLIHAAEELRTLEYAQRLSLRARNVMAGGEGRSTGRDLFEATLKGGAQALGVLPPGGEAGLVEGAPADMLSLDSSHPALFSRHGDAALDSWIFAARGNLVDCVWRRGTKVVEGGRHRARAAVADRFRAAVRKVLA